MLLLLAGAEGALLSWVNGQYLEQKGGRQADLKTGNVNEVETTGVKLEDRK